MRITRFTEQDSGTLAVVTANLPTNIIMDFRGFDSSISLILRGGILVSIGNFPESSSPAMLVGLMLVGGLGASHHRAGQKITTDYTFKRKEPTNDERHNE